MKKRWYLMVFCLIALVGCAGRTARAETPEAGEPTREIQVIRARPKEVEAALYIGTAGTYTVYPYIHEGEVTPDQLIAAIADLTGWDLSLDGPIFQNSSGITVTFSPNCALFTGPPEPQKEDFFVYDAQELCATILDSVCHTLQWNVVNENIADPKALSIYFRTSKGDLSLDHIGFVQPAGLPYGGLMPEAQVCSAQGRFLGATAADATFELDGETLSMSFYDSDIAATVSRVTPGLEVTIVYLENGDTTVLTGVY